MELINATQMVAGYAPGLAKDGSEHITLVIKGTFDLPTNGEPSELSANQNPLVEADVFSGEPGLSAPLYESDFAPTKPSCDVVLNGSAYAPGGTPVRSVEVGLKVGRVAKAFRVVGDRSWVSGMGGIGPGPTRPFIKKRISYDIAFGGTDRSPKDEADHDAFMPNPVGIGFRASLISSHIDGSPMPNTEERKVPVTSPLDSYVPMSFGVLPRGAEARMKYAGTYDDAWLENDFPLLPHDFDDRYFQCAPEDQQTELLTGGEVVTLINLTPDGRRDFQIPIVGLPISVQQRGRPLLTVNPAADTLVIEPDQDRFCLVWRHRIPVFRSIFEVVRATIGEPSPGRKRAQLGNKAYYAGLAEAVRGETDRRLEFSK